ncbi:HRDC domain-containing protein [Cytophagaceae bacterium DM2B3-1]|uniref:HRDC domain-containing protein n=1 Tax=Xanthocytophaga flava TaxID=3048013 RepID=A0ABT7CH73_9BACT|nr:HRDC domain-containing protein [Xanthocytophaga flavus]MDJ1493093.1 HRDC domain-containing protein [Xanthocytophaga flavus]
MILDQIHELILRFIENTDQPIFLTGKAGSGKTTFLHHIRANVSKSMAVVAPTAIAAINAGGVTLHSFFQIPFGPLLPSNQEKAFTTTSIKQINQEKAKLLKCLDLLIIDEISMVRADILDYIHSVLCQVRGSNRPFGGVQLLMIGDPYQLPPVYQNDWPVLSSFYEGPYFFNSRIFKQSPFLTFELDRVYRQNNPAFIEILNSIRSGNVSTDLLAVLNTRYSATLNADQVKDHITLSTHNKLVSDINQMRLEELEGEAHIFKAVITGDFPREAYPAEEELVLKEGAHVMFIKNDTSGKRQYYNGRSGRIARIEQGRIWITFLDDGSEFIVNPEIWHNVKYSLSETEGQINESNTGSFTQFPLRLSWAITIHKSQGLSFEKAVIDVNSAFAHGQTYVALSRCRSLEGLILKDPVRQQNIICDPLIVRFMKKALDEKPDMDFLDKVITETDKQQLIDLFDFSLINQSFKLFQSILIENDLSESKATNANKTLNQEVIQVANKFVKQDLSILLADPSYTTIWQSEVILNRLQKAAAYFLAKVTMLRQIVHEMYADQSLDDLSLDIYPVMNHLLVALDEKIAAFTHLPVASSFKDILDAVKRVVITYQPVSHNSAQKTHPKEVEITNPVLYEQLVSWRKEIALQRDVPEYTILSDSVLREISKKLPRSLSQLSQIKNFGQLKATDFGSELIRMIGSFLGENELFF